MTTIIEIIHISKVVFLHFSINLLLWAPLSYPTQDETKDALNNVNTFDETIVERLFSQDFDSYGIYKVSR